MTDRAEILERLKGDEKFLLLLPQTGIEAATQTAERIRQTVEKLRLYRNDVDIASTVSIGVAARSDEHRDLKSVISAADRALYRAKIAGRNRVDAVAVH